MSSFASKTNSAALKTEVDKIDVDKLKTTPTDLAKLTNAAENDLVKKADYNTKVTSIETQIAGLTKNTVDNLADITKLKAIDTNSFVLKTKLASDVTALENKIDTLDKKIPDISGLAKLGVTSAKKLLCRLYKTILKVSYPIIILCIFLEKGECFDFNHSLGCVYSTL